MSEASGSLANLRGDYKYRRTEAVFSQQLERYRIVRLITVVKGYHHWTLWQRRTVFDKAYKLVERNCVVSIFIQIFELLLE